MDIYTKNTWEDICGKHNYQEIIDTDWNIYKPRYARRLASIEVCRRKLNHGLIFFHVPKTAGRWLQRSGIVHDGFGGRYIYINDHRSVRNLSAVNANYQAAKDAGWLTFSIIRNPFDILVSMYGHTNEGGGHGGGWWDCHQYGKSRTEFLNNFPNKRNGGRGEFRRTLFHQTYRKNGKSEADIFIRYENLDTALKLLFDKNLIDSQIKKIVAKGERVKDYQQYYDDTSRKVVEETYAWELEKFGYSFDGVSDDRVIIFPWEVGQCPLDL